MLQVLHNKMLRIISGKRQSDKVNMQSLRSENKMMSVNQMTCYHILIETFNIIHFGSSNNIKNNLIPKFERTRQGKLIVPLVKKSSCQGFSYYAAKLWNKLPTEIKSLGVNNKPVDSKDLKGFKRNIKKWIWNGGIPKSH